MKRSNRLVLLVGIFLAVVAFILIAIMLSGGGGTPPDQPPTTTRIVVAARDFDIGTRITAADVTTREIPITERPGGALADPAVAIGQTARSRVTQGQLITTAVWGEGVTGTVDVLDVPPGKVGMSVRVDQVSGVGTVIKPGDYVDAVVAFRITPVVLDPETGAPAALAEGLDAGPTVKALLQGMQVLGTLLPPPPQAAEGAPPASGDASLNERQQIVILAVDLQQAEVLNYAQLQGIVAPNGITLVLRSLQDFQDPAGAPTQAPDVVTTGMILSILVDQYGVLIPDFGVVEVPVVTPAP